MSATHRSAPLALWRIAQAFLNVLYGLFGAPEDVARSGWVQTRTHKLIASWLRAGEVLVRHLVLIEAAALADLAPSARNSRICRLRSRCLRAFSADSPATWRVVFHALSPLSRAVSTHMSRRSRGEVDDCVSGMGPHGHRNAWPLAERYEALIRVFNTPAPYARRLSRRLKQAPRAVARVLAALAEATPLIGVEAFAEIRVVAAARVRWSDTS